MQSPRGCCLSHDCKQCLCGTGCATLTLIWEVKFKVLQKPFAEHGLDFKKGALLLSKVHASWKLQQLQLKFLRFAKLQDC